MPFVFLTGNCIDCIGGASGFVFASLELVNDSDHVLNVINTALRILKYKNNKTGEMTEYRAEEGDTFGVFVFAGYEPETELVKDFVKLNEQGYVETDEQQKTNIDGLYAAGDVCIKNLRQVVTAVGDGALAATELG